MRTNREYVYRMRLGLVLLGLVVFVVSTVRSVSALLTGDRLASAELLGAPPVVDTAFYGVTALASGLFVLWYVLHLLLYMKGGERLVVDNEGIEVPHSPWRRPKERIEFTKVKEVRDWGISFLRILSVRHESGVTPIPARMLPPSALDEILAALQSHVAHG